MFRFYFLFACIALSSVCLAKFAENQSIESEVEVIDNIVKFQEDYPELEVTPLELAYIQPYNTIRYVYGQRQVGDHLIAQGNNNFNYPNAQNSRLTLKYPQQGGLGSVVTYVEINVDQTTNLGKAYIVSGGIGQRHIAIVVEANNTYKFAYRVTFFGF